MVSRSRTSAIAATSALPAGAVRTELDGRSQAGGFRTAVPCDLVGGRLAGTSSDQANRANGVTDARQAGWAGAPSGRCLAQAILHDPVLARVVREDGDPTIGSKCVDRRVDRLRQDLEFAVDLDADGLERALGRVP